MSKIIQFFKDVKVELGKVVWPSRREALRATGIVILFSLFVAFFLGIIDFALAKTVKLILG